MKEIENLYVADVNTWKYEDTKGETMGIRFDWDANIGFGELGIYSEDGMHWKADTECLCNNEDKEFIKQILQKWVEQIEVVG